MTNDTVTNLDEGVALAAYFNIDDKEQFTFAKWLARLTVYPLSAYWDI